MTTLENNASNLEFFKAVLQDLRKCEKTQLCDFRKIILGRCFSFRQCKKQELTPILGKLFQLQKATRVETSSTAIDAGATDRSRRWNENEYDACLFVNGVKN